MNKVKELLIKVLDEGETTSVKDMKWPSLGIGKWLLISTAFLSPLLGCILGGTFMDVNSKEFTVLVIPLLLNCVVCLCWLLCYFLKFHNLTPIFFAYIIFSFVFFALLILFLSVSLFLSFVFYQSCILFYFSL